MRQFLVFLILCISSNSLFAQLYCPDPLGKMDESKYHISFGIGPTYLYGDRQESNISGLAGFMKGEYQILKGLMAGVEFQLGSLQSSAVNDSDIDNREVKNNYYGAGLGLSWYPFKFFSKKNNYRNSISKQLLEGFYLGASVLGVRNNYKDIYRALEFPSTYGPIERYDENGDPVFKEKINSLLLPSLNAGISFPINQHTSRSGKYFSLIVNSQFNFSNNDLLDGYMPYDADLNRIGTANDFYSFYSLGLKYSF